MERCQKQAAACALPRLPPLVRICALWVGAPCRHCRVLHDHDVCARHERCQSREAAIIWWGWAAASGRPPPPSSGPGWSGSSRMAAAGGRHAVRLARLSSSLRGQPWRAAAAHAWPGPWTQRMPAHHNMAPCMCNSASPGHQGLSRSGTRAGSSGGGAAGELMAAGCLPAPGRGRQPPPRHPTWRSPVCGAAWATWREGTPAAAGGQLCSASQHGRQRGCAHAIRGRARCCRLPAAPSAAGRHRDSGRCSWTRARCGGALGAQQQLQGFPVAGRGRAAVSRSLLLTFSMMALIAMVSACALPGEGSAAAADLTGGADRNTGTVRGTDCRPVARDAALPDDRQLPASSDSAPFWRASQQSGLVGVDLQLSETFQVARSRGIGGLAEHPTRREHTAAPAARQTLSQPPDHRTD